MKYIHWSHVSTVKKEYASHIVEIMRKFMPVNGKQKNGTHYSIYTEATLYDQQNWEVSIMAENITKEQKDMLSAIAYAYSMAKKS